MRKLFACVLLGILIQSARGQNAHDSMWIMENYYKIERMIPMRDGVKLFTSILVPKDQSEKHPVLMSRTPYSCRPYGEAIIPPFWNGHFRYFLRENYFIVRQDVRGRWMSEGTFVDVRPFNPNKKGNETDEASDTYDTIEWLLKNLQGNNGNVGLMGISYPGFYSTIGALSGHPALKAVSPQAPVTDWFAGDDFHHNGAFFLLDGFSFYAGRGFGYPRPLPTTESPVVDLKIPAADNYNTYLNIGPLKNFMKLTGDSIGFWKDLYAHPDYDDFWKARNIRNFVNNVPAGTATLVVGGLFDAEDCFGAWRTYEAIEKKAKNNNRIVMGPWYHGQWSSTDGSRLGNVAFGFNTSHWYQNNIEIPFFNYYLKGKGQEKIPEATIFFTGENKWRNFEQWPPAASENRNLFLHPGGVLSWTKNAGKSSFTEYTSDPAHPVPYTEDVHFGRTREYMTDDQRFAARRPDVVTWQTPVLNEDITVAGTLVADLVTSITGTDADFVVKVIDVFPDDFSYPGGSTYQMGGYQMLVRGEVMRGRYRKNFSAPQAFKPNAIEKVRFELPDIAHKFQKGHRIMVQIQSSWFPLVDRNPQKFVNIYEAGENDFQKANIRIYHDAG
ncbi:MAG: CocE/NonD family hydrolase, partial [Gemmatimonadaceae bacterium]|nr:CocE/NonD family hydrolase [Chitinophagaceae bacterium]